MDNYKFSTHLTLVQFSKKGNLSTAIDHLLSMKLVRESNVAGQISAVKRLFNTVIIAPCCINVNARPTAGIGIVNITKKNYPIELNS